MPSPTDFNLTPYYDDFTDSKKFHRVLFRPAFAVQARELTQSQTILQNQIENLSDHIFKKGAMVIPGAISYDLNYYSVKLSAKSVSDITKYNGVRLTGASSGVIANCVGVAATDGTDPDTLFVKYETSGTSNTATKFTNGETLNCTIDSAAATATVNTCHTGSSAYIGAGVFYINGFHVEVSEQVVVLDKYTNSPSYRVGLAVTESFVTPNDDASLNDNATGSSNVNAPGAHRFKIDLTLTKKTLTSTEDSNFVELLRLSEGIIQNRVRTTEYAVLEETLARRTFDESGDYSVRGFDIDVREHLLSGTNRGVFAASSGGLESKLALGISPGKAYVKGYEIETIGTTFVPVDKARDFDTENNFNTRFDLGNFVNVTNVHGSPDIGFVSGAVEAFKKVGLYSETTVNRGTENTGSSGSNNTIGRAKSKGFEYNSGTAVSGAYSSSSASANTFKHYLFDINMFTHLNTTGGSTFTTGEKITGGTSGATGTLESVSTTTSIAPTSISVASPGVVTTGSNHLLKDGQQIKFTSPNFAVDSVAVQATDIFTVRNGNGTTTFELFKADGTTAANVTSFTSSSAIKHGVVVLSSVNGTFTAGETITGGTSSTTDTIQTDSVGFPGVRNFELSAVKQIGMAGSPTYTSDTALDSTNGSNAILSGSISVSGNAVTGFNTRFTDELKIGDSVSFTNDAGTTETKLVEVIINNNSLLFTATSGASTKTIAARRRTKLNDSNKNTSIFKLPYKTIKTLKTTANSGLTDTNFAVRRHFTGNLSSNGDLSITAGTNETFTALLDRDFTVSIMSTGSGGTGAVGDILDLNGNNHEGDSIFTLGGSPTGKTLTLDFGANYAGHTVKVLATINRSVAGSKTKTLNSAQTVQISSQSTIESGVIGIGKADIFAINSVKMAADFSTNATNSDTDITDRFDLDNGQRDNFYDIGRLKLKDGALSPTGRILINFDFFSHGSGDYFDVDSYSGVVDYSLIPSYISDTTGQKFELRDVLDFRPRVDDASTINSGGQDRSFDGTGASTVDVVKFNSDVSSDFEYYLPKIVKVFLDKDGTFRAVEGASSLSPQTPKNLDTAMHLYTLQLDNFTLTTDHVEIETIDNRRYTMRDIGALEKRIDNVEYYTQLNMLEQSAQSLQIQDADGFDRFKNGFIVDNFTGHGIGDVGNLDYKAAMDMAEGHLRPTFNEDAVQLIERDDDGTEIVAADRTAANYQKTGDLLTLPYTETTLVDQPFASKTLNVNPFNVFTWIGTIELTPPGDEWKETERAPELVINNQGGFDTLISGNPNLANVELGTIWNEWQDQWAGRPRDMQVRNIGGAQREQTFAFGIPRRVLQRQEVTTGQLVQQTRTGVRNVLVPQTVRNSIGDRIINVAFVPFVRARTITFAGTRFKPNTRVYPYFDNIDISTYVTPTGGSLGGNLVSDANGAVSGTFAIPDPTNNSNPRWRTGTRVFRLTSSQTDDRSSDVETSGEVDYTARGILETTQETILSTREPRLVRESTVDNRQVTRTSTRETNRQVGWWDPLAQTFLIDDSGGVFVSSVDLFFSTKDDNIPITVQIREVVNGYPGTKILPFSEVSINPSAVNVSADSTAATTFTFNSPVYIQENVEYALVVLANSVQYNAWVARMGDTQVNSDRTISEQPYAGVLFKSQNGTTWTADQNEDIKFKLKRCEFNKDVTGQVTLTNDSLPVRTLKNNALRTTNSSKVIRVFHPNHGMHGTSNNVTIAGVPSGTYNGIAHSDINGTYTSISNVTLDSYDITSPSSSNANATGDIGGASLTATQNRLYDVINLSLQTMTVPETSIGFSMRPTTGKSVHGSESEFSLTSSTNKINVVGNDNIYFTAPQMVASDINQTNEMSGQKSLFVQLDFSSSNSRLSPVLDVQRMSAFTIQNRLNNPSSSNTPTFVNDEQPSGSSSAAVYCTRPITLETPSTAFDVRLTQSVRSSSSVRVFFRATSAEEVRNIDDLNWTPFNTDGSEDVTVTPSENQNDFKEYKYSASGITEFSAFQIKIVMKGNNSAYPPVIKDMRGIALAV